MSSGDVGDTALTSSLITEYCSTGYEQSTPVILPLMSRPNFLIITSEEQRVLRFATISEFVGM